MGDILTDLQRLMLLADYQTERTRLGGNAATQDSAPNGEGLILFRVGHRIDEHGPFSHSKCMAFVDFLVEYGHFREPARKQPAIAETRRVALAGSSNFHVEAVAFLNAGPQERPH